MSTDAAWLGAVRAAQALSDVFPKVAAAAREVEAAIERIIAELRLHVIMREVAVELGLVTEADVRYVFVDEHGDWYVRTWNRRTIPVVMP